MYYCCCHFVVLLLANGHLWAAVDQAEPTIDARNEKSGQQLRQERNLLWDVPELMSKPAEAPQDDSPATYGVGHCLGPAATTK